MPLPFMKFRKDAGVSVAVRPSDFSEPEHQEEDKDQALIAVSGELLIAVSNKDTRAISEALRAAFEILDSEPHVEGPHLEEQE